MFHIRCTTINEWLSYIFNGTGITEWYNLEFQKAFDKPPHGRLVKKLHTYVIKGMVLYWIVS